jgi:hypothetical protein
VFAFAKVATSASLGRGTQLSRKLAPRIPQEVQGQAAR